MKIRSGYRIQANKEQDCMKVLYYVEKELAEFDPAKRTYEKFRSGYRIQANKEQDCMKVLYYVEKELAEFDPAKRTYEKCKAHFDLTFMIFINTSM
ncbi:UNVERIFIED_CONTAM: hypothetical protein FKN15_016527 [Acipenser sinensis]